MYGECHAHIFMNGYNYQEAVKLHKGHVNEESIRTWFREYQKRGVTFIRDGGDALGVSEYAKEIAGEYGIDYRTPVFAIHKKGRYGGIVGRGFEDMREYRELVAEVKRRKGDFIKIMLTGIMDFHSCGVVTGTPLTGDEIREMIHIAHEEGFSVMAHVNSSRPVREAALAGVDSVEHGNYIDRDCIQAMAESGAVWVPTIATIRNLIGCGRFPDDEVRKIYESAAENLRLAYTLGVRLALGSDAGAYMVPHGQGIEDEYAIFQQILGAGAELERVLKEGERAVKEKFRS
jgi:imidazolonepropionase-like amidohydrolase